MRWGKYDNDIEKAERFAKANYRQIYDAWPRHAMRNIEPQPTSLWK